MKKIIFLFFISFLLLAGFAFAVELEVDYPVGPGGPLPDDPTLPEFVNYLYNFSIGIAGLIALFSLVYGGFRYMVSVGSPIAMAEAKDQVTAGIIGLIILLGSYIFLTIVNPELAIIKLDKEDFPAAVCGNGKCEIGEGLVVCPADCKLVPIDLTADVYKVYEDPIGQLIENALEPVRLNTISVIADDIVDKSEALTTSALEFYTLLTNCSCNYTSPDPSSCTVLGLDEFCPIPVVQCVDDPDTCPDRDAINAAKRELVPRAEALTASMETMLPPLTSLKKDEQRLETGAEILKETINPINYDNLLELKQLIINIGGEVKIIPFTVLSRTIRGRGDPATFYIDEERVIELLGLGDFPDFPRFDTAATCDDCEIDIHYSSPELVNFLKGRKSEFVDFNPEIDDGSCPGGKDCWDYVIDWADTNGWNPAFILTLWREEGGWDKDGIACPPGGGNCSVLGCLDGTRNIVDQLSCFAATTDPVGGNCGPAACVDGRTELCSFMRCWSGGPDSCLLSGVRGENPNFWANVFSWYNELIPTGGDFEGEPIAPSGTCTVGGGVPLPPGLAGCPLFPDSFSISCGWGEYPGHLGIDLPAPSGTAVYAIADGTARAAGSLFHGCGIHVYLDAGEYGVFKYCHLTGDSHLRAGIPEGGIPVSKGDVIGFVDNTGHSEGDHLHLVYYPDGINASPVECAAITCIDEAPGIVVGVCTDTEDLCPL